MRRNVLVVLLLCGIGVALWSCGSDANPPTAQQDSSFPPARPPAALAVDGASCGPPTHPGGSLVENVTTPPAWGIAVRDDGLTYFTEPYEGGVGITSTQSRTLEGFIPTGSVPTGVDFSPDGGTAYVTNQLSQNVGVINVATAQQVATISTLGRDPFVVRVIGTVEVGFAPNAFAVHPDGRIMYVSAFVGGTVTEMDMFSGMVLRTFYVGGTPQDMAVTRNGKRLYVGNEAGYLNEINLETGQLAENIPLAGGAFGIGVTPDDVQAYVSIPFAGLVQVFNLQSRRLAQTIDVGGQPRRIGFSRQGHIGAVANLSGYVTLVR